MYLGSSSVMGLHREVARLCSRVDHVDHWLRRIAIDFVAGTNHNPHKTLALPHRVPAARNVCLPGRGDGDLFVTQDVTTGTTVTVRCPF